MQDFSQIQIVLKLHKTRKSKLKHVDASKTEVKNMWPTDFEE